MMHKLFCMFLLFLFISIPVAANQRDNLKRFEKKFKIDKQVGKLQFCDESGKVINEMPIQKWVLGKSSPARVSISDNGKFICVNTVTKEVAGEDVGEANAVVYDEKGNKLWTVQHNYSSYAIVSPNGKYIIGDGPWYKASRRVYYQDGTFVNVTDSSEDSGPAKIAFSKDGSFVAIVYETSTFPQTKTKTGPRKPERSFNLLVLDEKGDELWRKKKITEGTLYSGIWDITIDGDYLLAKFFQPRSKSIMEVKFDKAGSLINQQIYKREK